MNIIMASLITDDVLELPEDFVTSSSGLGIDIGKLDS